MSNDINTLKAGDVVVLNSGGPKMTIRFIDSLDDRMPHANCTWFHIDGNNNVVSPHRVEGRFAVNCLKKV